MLHWCLLGGSLHFRGWGISLIHTSARWVPDENEFSCCLTHQLHSCPGLREDKGRCSPTIWCYRFVSPRPTGGRGPDLNQHEPRTGAHSAGVTNHVSGSSHTQEWISDKNGSSPGAIAEKAGLVPSPFLDTGWLWQTVRMLGGVPDSTTNSNLLQYFKPTVKHAELKQRNFFMRDMFSQIQQEPCF